MNLALNHIVIGLLLCLRISGIPLGVADFEMSVSLMPLCKGDRHQARGGGG